MAKILLCHEFFWPDAAPYGSILKSIGEHWAVKGGHEVCVFTGCLDTSRSLGNLSYEEEDSKSAINIYRASLPFSAKNKSKVARLINSLFFSVKFIWFAHKSSPFDLVMNSTMPPLFSGIAGLIASRMTKSCWIYHLMDIFPEVIKVSEINTNTVGYRGLLAALTYLDTWAVSKASYLVVLSEDMRQTMLDRPGGKINSRQLIVQPNFAPPDWEGAARSSEATVPWGVGTTKIVFAGNLGRFQGLDRILGGYLKAEKMGSACELAFLGDGYVAEDLRKIASDSESTNVHFTGLLSRFSADKVILESDICIVSLANGVERVAFPTKIGSYLIKGKPLFAVGKIDSSLERLVLDNEIGCFASISSEDDIAQGFLRCSEPENRRRWRASAEKFGRKYDPENVLPAWDDLLKKVLTVT